jgi:hypothetical protein
MYGPLLSITHSARPLIAASETSAREGAPFLAIPSNTCVAQITGTWAASQSQTENFLLHFGQPLEPDLDTQIAARHHYSDRRGDKAG